ncbi:nitrate reductase [Crenobacter cavernae]|uniref:Nitrate reductase n=1 Tax=Crenobacter cavernae TaxID=2290923 RepID=A0ABY0FGR0_9NEIS|nr:nitrate reductase [Crenobacter cavernae]RXZ45576.1 nitrate reductase [Crenobacter cavernae]
MTHTVRSTCCYCGVGCGVLIHTDGERITGIDGDPQHPANFGRLCTKGRTLPLTTGDVGRALAPMLREARDEERRPVAWDTAIDTAADRFAAIIREHGPDAVAFYLSGQLLTEDYYVFNKLAKGLVGTANVDTNSRLCMSSAVSAYKLAFGADGPPTCYDDLEHADLVLFAGSNAAYAHPVLFRRLEEARAARPGVRWIAIDPRRTDTAAMADLHLAIQPGTDVALFHGMLHHLIWEGRLDADLIDGHSEGFEQLKNEVRAYPPHRAAEICGIEEKDLVTAADWFGEAGAALSLYCMGLNQSSHGTDKNLALINLHLATGQLGRPGTGPFSLTGQPNAMGGREVGGMATMLASHRDLANASHREELAALWGVPAERLPAKPGLTAVELFDALEKGTVKAVWIACTNPAHSMPDLAKVQAALKNAEFVVLQEAFSDTDTAPFADLLLPASSWGEKEGVVTNSERRISRVRAAVRAPGDARADWRIARDFARALQQRLAPHEPDLFAFDSPEDVFVEYRATTVGRDIDIGGVDYALLEAAPQQWPLPAGEKLGRARLYTDRVFNTASGRARFHAVAYLPVAEAPNARYPFRLLSGRLRDQWHGMSRSGRVPQLFEHVAEARLAMNPGDMARRSLADGDLVEVSSKRGKLVLPVEASNETPSGSLFLPMHWNGQFLQDVGVNLLTLPARCDKSAQPELKHAAVRLEKLDLAWRCVAVVAGNVQVLLAKLRPLLAGCRYASLSLVGRERPAVRLTMAGESAPEGWLERLDAALGLAGGPDGLGYRDEKRGIDKRAQWQDGRLVAFRLAGETAAEGWLTEIMRQGGGWSFPRPWAFLPSAAAPAGAPAPVRMVCNCNGVSESAIAAALKAGGSLAAAQAATGCGTACGSCLPECKRLAAATLAQTEHAPA